VVKKMPQSLMRIVMVIVALSVTVGMYVHRPYHRGQPAATGAAFRIHINTADAETLDLLQGIGNQLVLRIIAYRQAHGPFENYRYTCTRSGHQRAHTRTPAAYGTL